MATGALGSQKSVGQYPATQILFELFDHEIWKWIPQVLFNLLLKRQPIGLNQFVECCFFGFVALVVVSLGIRCEHWQRPYLQLPWPFRFALVMAVIARRSGNTMSLFEIDRHAQVIELFGRGLNPR